MQDFKSKIKESFLNGKLKVKSFNKETCDIEWKSLSNVLRHNSDSKVILSVSTEDSMTVVTEDHSLFLFDKIKEIKTSELRVSDSLIASDGKDIFPKKIVSIDKIENRKYMYDLSIPGNENFFLSSGILAHNSYSVSGVSLDIDKSSKYESMKNNFIEEFEKSRELAKRSIKIIKGLQQPKYGIGLQSALGPYSRPGIQSRRNYVSGAGSL